MKESDEGRRNINMEFHLPINTLDVTVMTLFLGEIGLGYSG